MRYILILIVLLFVKFATAQNDKEQWFIKAEKAFDYGQDLTAIELYSKCIQIDSMNAKAYLGRARSYNVLWNARQQRDSFCYFEYKKDAYKAFELDSTDAFCNFWMAQNMGLSNEVAIDFFDRAIRYSKNEEQYYAGRGYCFIKLKRFEQALADYIMAYKLLYKSENADGLETMLAYYACLMGICHAKLGDFKEAEKNLLKAINYKPKDNLYHLHLGTIKSIQGDYQKAIEIYRKILDRNPEMAVAYLFLGNVYQVLNEPKLAEEFWSLAIDKGIKLNSSNREINNQLDYFLYK